MLYKPSRTSRSPDDSIEEPLRISVLKRNMGFDFIGGVKHREVSHQSHKPDATSARELITIQEQSNLSGSLLYAAKPKLFS